LSGRLIDFIDERSLVAVGERARPGWARSSAWGVGRGRDEPTQVRLSLRAGARSRVTRAAGPQARLRAGKASSPAAAARRHWRRAGWLAGPELAMR